jgi:hypothetical protein
MACFMRKEQHLDVTARNAHPSKESNMTNSALSEFRQMPALRQRLHAALRMLVLVLGLGTLLPSQATVVTLTFDEFTEGTSLSSVEYQGLMVSGAAIIAAPNFGLPFRSMPNVAYAPDGLMQFDVTPAFIGNIQSVSVYLTGPSGVGLYGYDVNGNLLAWSLSDISTSNLLFSIAASEPITHIEIHNGGAAFYIDDLTVVTDQPSPGTVPEPATLWMLGMGLLGVAGVMRRRMRD